MQPKNLGWKFAFVALLVILSLYSIWAKELRQGTDLKGGHILTFEVQLPEDAPGDVLQQVISTLKKRIDPTGLAELTWRPVGKSRFEVRMPMGTEEARLAKLEYDRLLEALEDGNLRRSDLSRVESLTGEERDKAVAELGAGSAARAEALRKVGRTSDAVAEAQRKLAEARAAGRDTAEAEKDLRRARFAHWEAQQLVLETNIDTEKLREVLDLYVSGGQAERLPVKEVRERRKELEARLTELRAKHPARREQIDLVASAYKNWKEKRTGLDDPADLKRLVAKAGVLEFRIAPVLPLPGTQRDLALTQGQYERYLNQLEEEGPQAGRVRNDPFLWFPIRREMERVPTDLMVGKYAGKRYVLLYNQQGFTMLQRLGPDQGRPWSLEANPTTDSMGRPAVGFELDARGAARMGELTGRHGPKPDRPGRYMAILLDDEVYSAPTIRATIYARGIIEGSFSVDQVNDLVRILNAGALAARVNPDPVSEKTVAASIGADNRRAGIRAAFWGLVGVAVFMFVYYLAAGGIADVALMLNIVLVLGAMSFIEAVFTLPGIAGVILTIGMAVDANVLIFERLREEQAKTQSMRMAVRNAYASAASAILDGNATTLITCLILGWVGTEEVSGFAITLGLGVMWSLFTSLVVTRWIFQLLVETSIVKRRVRMLAFIGTPKIDWMSKRRLFWVISLALVVAGILALVYQGRDLLGLEFSSGTQATFRFRTGSLVPYADGRKGLPDRARIASSLRAAGEKLAGRRRDEVTSRIERLTGEVAAAESKVEQLASQAAAAAGDAAAELAAQQRTAEADLNELAARLQRTRQQLRALTRLPETLKVETLLASDKAVQWLKRFGKRSGEAIAREEFLARKHPEQLFASLDADGDGKLTRAELERLPEWSYQVSTAVADVELLREVVREAFGPALAGSTRVTFDLQTEGRVSGLGVELSAADEGRTHIDQELAEQKVAQIWRESFRDFVGGAMFVLRDLTPPLTQQQLTDRIRTMRSMPDFEGFRYNRTRVIPLTAAGEGEGFRSFAVLVLNPSADFFSRPEEWREFASDELKLVSAALAREKSLESLQEFDPAIAERAAQLAIIAFVLSWAAIIAYLWLRFGSARWGLAAVVCLIHDVIIAVGMVGLSAYLADTVVGRLLMIEGFQIDMAVVAAFLTIIGYSVNDTIVVFDRIRENRGKLATVDEGTINRSINQVISRTLLTTTTTLIAVLIMYIWGGSGIHAFTYALLVGIVFGTYSSIAIASPLLLGFRHAVIGQAAPAKARR